jgi:hypothetical protein
MALSLEQFGVLLHGSGSDVTTAHKLEYPNTLHTGDASNRQGCRIAPAGKEQDRKYDEVTGGKLDSVI